MVPLPEPEHVAEMFRFMNYRLAGQRATLAQVLAGWQAGELTVPELRAVLQGPYLSLTAREALAMALHLVAPGRRSLTLDYSSRVEAGPVLARLEQGVG